MRNQLENSKISFIMHSGSHCSAFAFNIIFEKYGTTFFWYVQMIKKTQQNTWHKIPWKTMRCLVFSSLLPHEKIVLPYNEKPHEKYIVNWTVFCYVDFFLNVILEFHMCRVWKKGGNKSSTASYIELLTFVNLTSPWTMTLSWLFQRNSIISHLFMALSM